MRQLRMALLAAPQDPNDASGGGLPRWAACVRRSAQPCLLLSVEDVLIDISEPARRLLGAAARPGAPLADCWHELSMQSGQGVPRSSLLSRSLACGSPAHSVLRLALASGPATVQVVAAPLQDSGARAEALLAFFWLMSTHSEPGVHAS